MKKRIILKVGLSILVVFFTLCALEFICGYFLNGTRRQFSSQVLYEHFPWGDEFLKQRSITGVQYMPYSIWNNVPINSKFQNYTKDGVRITVNHGESEKKSKYKVFIFGGSTVQNSETPDDYTIASRLSFHLNNAHKDIFFECHNYGVSAHVNTQSLMRFFHLLQLGFPETGKPDLVIFYDGFNDISNGVFLESPALHWDYKKISYKFNSIKQYLGLRLSEAIYSTNILRWMRDFATQKSQDEKKLRQHYSKFANEQVKLMLENIKITKAISKQFNIDFMYILQPSLITLSDQHPYNQDLKNTIFKVDQVKKVAYQTGYEIFRKSLKGHALDFTSIFNGCNTPVYTDFCHTGPYANDVIAEKISLKVLGQMVEK